MLWTDVLDIAMMILSVSGGAAWLAAIPQVQKTIKYLPIAVKVVNTVAANVGAAKNKD